MKTKYAIIIPDGAADDPLEELDDRTPFEAATTPNIDAISISGRQGTVRTIPSGMPAGSDVAQMSVLGYDPKRYYTGRAPIEAVAQDINLTENDWVFRCNLVTIADGRMADHSAGHISTDEAEPLIHELQNAITDDNVTFFSGISYRHLCVISGIDFAKITTHPPHDIIGQKVSRHLPSGKNATILTDIMARSQRLFEDHDVNRIRRDLGENPVSSAWFWGQGQKAIMERFEKRFGIKGVAITAVDLVRGLAKLIGFDLIDVPGATGFIDTNYAGKGDAAVKALDDYDLVFVHIEAPDEAGHSGNAVAKANAISQIDKHIVGPVYEKLQQFDSYRILVMPDHPTPIETQAHSNQPVPFAMAGADIEGILEKPFTEDNAFESGFNIEKGPDLMEYFLNS